MPTAQTMSGPQAGQLAWRIRKLHRRGDLTHADLALADTLLWSVRKSGSAVATASYSCLSRLARIARATVAAGLKRLESLGVLRRIKRRVRVVWGQGASASRQDTSEYVLQTPSDSTEFNSKPVMESLKIIDLVPQAAVRAAQEALAARRRAAEEKLLNKGAERKMREKR